MKTVNYKLIKYHHLSAVTSPLFLFKGGCLLQPLAISQVKDIIANDYKPLVVATKVFILVLLPFTSLLI